MGERTNGNSSQRNIYVTLRGLPLSFHLQWPFHKSTSGADFWVLHGDIRLGNTDGLHAPVSVNLSATVREVMPSLEAKDAIAPVINALRKEVDRRQIEFVKSGKLLPVNFSSRHYDFKRNKWVFGKATDDVIALFLERKVYWQTRLVGERTWIADPTEESFLETTTTRLLEVAGSLAAQGLIALEGVYATARASLMEKSREFESAMQEALKELEKKHEFERG